MIAIRPYNEQFTVSETTQPPIHNTQYAPTTAPYNTPLHFTSQHPLLLTIAAPCEPPLTHGPHPLYPIQQPPNPARHLRRFSNGPAAPPPRNSRRTLGPKQPPPGQGARPPPTHRSPAHHPHTIVHTPTHPHTQGQPPTHHRNKRHRKRRTARDLEGR